MNEAETRAEYEYKGPTLLEGPTQALTAMRPTSSRV